MRVLTCCDSFTHREPRPKSVKSKSPENTTDFIRLKLRACLTKGHRGPKPRPIGGGATPALHSHVRDELAETARAIDFHAWCAT
jgi:hypothetical protein